MTASNLHPLALVGKADFSGGSLQGYCHTTYAHLIACFGPPHTCNGDKTTVEWAYRCANGETFHVYDWKLLATPLSPYNWHIGGTHPDVLKAFERVTGLKTKSFGWGARK
jgi:hypothetical protein